MRIAHNEPDPGPNKMKPAEQPLSESLTGDKDSGGRAGQGGMTDAETRSEDPAEGNYRDIDDEDETQH